MKFDLKTKENKLYRGSIPFYLINNDIKKIIYISNSNRNIEDYYFGIKDFSKKNVIKIENSNLNKEDRIGNKYNVIENIKEKKQFIMLMSLDSALETYFDEVDFLELKVDKEYKIDKIINYLEKNNYNRNYLLEKKGEYSLRGDILDVYPVKNDKPIRIEFFDDLIEKIKYFDIETQKSIENIKKIKINPNLIIHNKLDLIDIIKDKNIKVVIENEELLDFRLEEYILLNRDKEEELREKYKKIKKESDIIELKRFTNEENIKFQDYNYVKSLGKNNNIIIFSEEKKRYKEIFNNLLEIKDIQYFEGFKTDNKIILTDRELKGIRLRKTEKRKESLKFNNINQIRENDFIIHENYGVGIYLGIDEINNRDYLKIKYADEDSLYVPIEHINRIEKYIVEPGKTPDIYKLGTKGFKKRKMKIKEDILEFAKELIEIQAKREARIGFKFSEDTIWQEEFEEGFPYNETKDQMKAIIEVKEDMESYKVMDRIVCGDVGYGKTEVALRAAFKCVMEGKQVAVLAPTTVLVNQHFERFSERFKNFPIEIDMLSRLKTQKQQEEISEKLKRGIVDVIIGTHRLIQEDISFKDIGILIIDEEQKFGVKAKEKIKKVKSSVDVLTLTATPIPRTLNFALLGIKDISIIETPPSNRLPIETEFIEKDNNLIKTAILKELSRDGQIFYVFNRVKGIENKVKDLEKILPAYIKISHIHGRMSSSIIKERIDKFENGEFDVLVTTTIIENGIDIENVNTILIDDYEKLGLSQIYQLRGRVGRSGRKAYCYLLGNKEKKLTAKGSKKVLSLMNMENLGAGFQLSLEDMKIRGAGEILGDRQHGAIETFGYDLYLKMLNEEIDRIKTKKPDILINTKIELKINGYIPDEYIEKDEKLKIYKRLVLINTKDELLEMNNELIDRFGKLPEATKKLFDYFKIKIISKEKGVSEIKEEKDGFYIGINENKIALDRINVLILEGKIKYLQKIKKIFLKNKLLDFLEKL